jgi:hypothetical protein
VVPDKTVARPSVRRAGSVALTASDGPGVAEAPIDEQDADQQVAERDAVEPLGDESEEARTSRWRRLSRVERRLAVLLLCAPLLGAVGVMAAELVPDERIADQLVAAQSAELLISPDSDQTPLGTTAERYTECTAFSIGLGDRPGEDLVANALLSGGHTGCSRLGSALREYSETGALKPGFPYLRYWHGYSVITRPALAVFGVSGARWIAFAISMLAVGGMCAAVKRSFGSVTMLLVVGPALLTSDLVVAGLSASTAIGSACAWVAGWMAFRAVALQPRWWTAGLVGAVAGATSAYFDLMTTLPGAFALTAVGATLGACATTPRARWVSSWKIAAAALVGWAAGLIWMWGSKWVIAATVLGFDEVNHHVRGPIGFRLSSGSHGFTSRIRGLTSNLDVWWGEPLTPWVVIGTLAAVVVLMVTTLWRRAWHRVPWGVALCSLIAAVPTVAWYMVLSNHSQIHPQLVYRSMPIAFGGSCALIYVALRRSTAPEETTL